MSTAGLANELDQLCEADPAVLGDGETVVALYRQLARLEAVVTRASAAFDAGGAWEADGARSAAAWLSTRCRVPTSTARRRVRLGRALRVLETVEAAWLAGDIGDAQAGLLVGAAARNYEDFARDEQLLVDKARHLRFGQFVTALAYWCQCADPDGDERNAARQYESRRLHLSQGLGGGLVAGRLLDPIDGAIVAKALRAIEDELFEADWAEARAQVGEGACGADLARSAAQRRADALVEMARRAQAMPAGARPPEPLFSVLVGYETLAGRICQLANGTVVSPASLLRWLDAAWVERVVFDGPDRVKNVGVRRRLFDGATRPAVQVRDRECYHEFCDRPAEDCEVDHATPWAAGGLTVDDNGRPACSFHNRQRHRRP